jgi:beta-lactamase regulating signal transducer with metallopeptidase domain
VVWVTVYVYNRYALRDRPRARVLLVGLAIGLPLYAELGSYLVFLLRPAADSGVGRHLSYIHQTYLQRLNIDFFLAPAALAAIAAVLGLLLLISLLRFAYGSYTLHRVVHTSHPLAATAHAAMHQQLAQLARANDLVLPPVRVIAIPAPLAFTTGIIRPQIYITEALLELLSADEQLAVFCHELAHVQRRDNLWNWLVRLLRDMAWFVPFNHVGWQWMVKSQDEDCDALAIRLTREPLALARALVKVSGAWSQGQLPPLLAANAFAAARSDVATRVGQMIALSDDAVPVRRRAALVGVYLIVAGMALLALLPTLLGS